LQWKREYVSFDKFIHDMFLWLSDNTNRWIVLSGVVILVGLFSYFGLRNRSRFRAIGLGALIVSVLLFVQIWAMLITDINYLPQIYRGVVWTVFSAVGVYFASVLFRKMLVSQSLELEKRHKIRSVISWASLVVFIILLVMIWSEWFTDIGMFLGILGAGLAMSMQETLLCIAGWCLLMLRKTYDIGDRVEINSQVGDVIDINLFQTTLLEVGHWVDAEQSTGRMLILPNSDLFRHHIMNYTKGFPFIWNELSITVTYESDWEEAKKIVLQQAEEEAEKIAEEVDRQIRAMQSNYAIHYERLQPIVYTSIADSGITLTLRHLCPVRKRRPMAHAISEAILHEILRHPKIDFAYPTSRIVRNTEEGKSALGGPLKP